MAEAKIGVWGAESVARGVEQLYPWQVGNKAVPLKLMLLERKAAYGTLGLQIQSLGNTKQTRK